MSNGSPRRFNALGLFWPASFKPAPGNDQDQALVRFCLTLAFALAVIVLQWKGEAIYNIWWAILAYGLFAYIWIWITGCNLMPFAWRLHIGLVLDNVLLALAFYLGGSFFSLASWSPAAAAIGYGLRFGSRYTFYSVTLGILCTGCALLWSPYWSQQPLFSTSILITLFVIPSYAVRLSKQMTITQHELERKAAVLETTSRTDALTGLINRRGLLELLTDHLQALPHAAHPSALLFIDLDDFKAINDAVGHIAGDLALKSAAEHLVSCLRPDDYISRLGGDEFVVLIPRIVTEREAYNVSMRILEQFHTITIPGSPDPGLSASIGICQLPHPNAMDAESALHIADRLMYEAKRSGKNQIVFLDPAKQAIPENSSGTFEFLPEN
ncbi:MAG: diguanylate cyclase [Betaproteobacteria bacterium]|nr:diguanylate cyclase [Betaproteobacteria bacterium]MDE2131487.1 diguanylate cyclase [Betaproteobacteria bacterium]MDE2211526.1 diguanylate cyclase [Betaproteobacteria bacterium]MDE2355081.1 diguanylate cyclase [Betaproteobacteria bacterium]